MILTNFSTINYMFNMKILLFKPLFLTEIFNIGQKKYYSYNINMYIHHKGKICAPFIPAQSYHSLNLLNEESYPPSSQETCVRVTLKRHCHIFSSL